MTTPTAAERATECLPCICGDTEVAQIRSGALHFDECPANLRPVVAAAMERAVLEERASCATLVDELEILKPLGHRPLKEERLRKLAVVDALYKVAAAIRSRGPA